MSIKIYPDNPNGKQLAKAVEVLENDGVIIYPTDSVYAFGCSVRSSRGIERLRAIKGKSSAALTLVCPDLSTVADYARVDNPTFRTLKHNLPGPFTFILKASSRMPDKALEKRRNVGVRIPANAIAAALVRELGAPMMSASVREIGEVDEYTTDPELIEEKYGRLVDLVIDGGIGDHTPTTLVDLSGDEPEVIREGKGDFKY